MFLSRGVSDEFLDDFEAAVPEAERTGIKFTDVVTKMTTRYTPNSNKVLNHYLFHRLEQKSTDSFDDFVHKVTTSASQCDFQCSPTCTVNKTLIRDQIVAGTNNGSIRDEALKKQYDLNAVIENGRTIESGAIAASGMQSSEKLDINRTTKSGGKGKSKNFICFKCESNTCPGFQKCKFAKKQCPNCKKMGHAKQSRFCKNKSGESSKVKKKTKKKRRRKTPTAQRFHHRLQKTLMSRTKKHHPLRKKSIR